MASLTRNQLDAAQEFARAAIESLPTQHGIHAATTIAGAARMAGTFLFRSLGLPVDTIPAGTVVLSVQANEEGPRLIEVLGGVLAHLGTPLDPDKLGGPPPPEHQAREDVLDAQRRLAPGLQEITARYGLSLREAADAGAAATALLIHQHRQALDPHLAFGIAVYGFIEGAKTAPDPAVA